MNRTNAFVDLMIRSILNGGNKPMLERRDENYSPIDSMTQEERDQCCVDVDGSELLRLVNDRGLDWILEELEVICADKVYDEPYSEHRWRQIQVELTNLIHKLYTRSR